jgi:tRNA pseudouridine13 synthase
MKIRARLEDFIVEEILSVSPQQRGRWQLLKMTKRRLNTTDAVSTVARALGIPVEKIGYAGRKDRHALTTQYITVPAHARLPSTLPDTHIALEPAGYVERPLAPADMKGNRFLVTVRDLTPEEATTACHEAEVAGQQGFINYFDDQRFGPWDATQGFLAEKVIQGHFNGALKHYLTHLQDESKTERDKKTYFLDHWGEWGACRQKARTAFEKMTFDHLIQHPKGQEACVKNIPGPELSFHFASFGSFLWNEVCRRWLARQAPKHIRTYAGVLGPYLFDVTPRDPSPGTVSPVFIPTVASRLKTEETLILSLYHDLLGERGLRLAQFNLTRVRQAFFKSMPRAARVVPEQLTIETDTDESSPERKEKIIFSFFLPKGSFATMLVKRIFSTPA